MESKLSGLAARLGIDEEELLDIIFNSSVDIDRISILEEYRAIEKGILGLPGSLAGIGAGSLTEKLGGSDSSVILKMFQNHGGRDISISVSSSTPFYVVRVMQGMCLYYAGRHSVSDIFGLDKEKYDTRYAMFTPKNEKIVTKSGLIVYDGGKTRRRMFGADTVSAYLSIGKPLKSPYKRTYFELDSWLKTESLNDDYKGIVHQLRLLPNAVKTVVGKRVQESM